MEENHFAIVDALQATVDGSSVRFVHEKNELTGWLAFHGTFKACGGYVKSMKGEVTIEIKKSIGRKTEKTVFSSALNLVAKKSTKKVFK